MKKLIFSIGFAIIAMLAVFNLAAAEPAKVFSAGGNAPSDAGFCARRLYS